MVKEYCYILLKRSIKGIMVLAIFLSTGLSLGQITNEQRKEIHQLSNKWNSKYHPGGVVGVIKGDDIIYLEAYGLASLEYDV